MFAVTIDTVNSQTKEVCFYRTWTASIPLMKQIAIGKSKAGITEKEPYTMYRFEVISISISAGVNCVLIIAD
jgi:hypothetical protein